jgi:hypothetical protein
LGFFWTIGKIKQRRIGDLSPINLALIPTDAIPLGFVPDLSAEVGDNSIDGEDDVHGPTTAFQGCCALATDTPPPMVAAILWSATLGH